VNINMSFFKHKENVLVDHCCLCPVWKVATAKQKQWIWEQLNIMYLIASSLKKVPKELFVHLRKLLDRVTQTLFKKDFAKTHIKEVREQAIQIMKDLGEEQFTSLVRYMFLLLNCPYSPIPEMVPFRYRSHSKKGLVLIRSPQGMKLMGQVVTPFLKLAKDDFQIPLEVPEEKEFVGSDGKMDELKMSGAFRKMIESFLQSPENVLQNLVDNKETAINKVKGTWARMTTLSILPKTTRFTMKNLDDSDDEFEEEKEEKKSQSQSQSKSQSQSQLDDDDGEPNLATILVDFIKSPPEDETSRIPDD